MTGTSGTQETIFQACATGARRRAQTITLRRKPAAVVLSPDDYDQLIGAKPSLAEYLLSGPAWDDDFVEEVNRRSETMIRPVEF
ncbi:prevent-host-death protein [Mesorhizobium sp. M0847]|uniref:prevent-host-death protein n=1 Tax=unclassified Mesorhizobium TaxID=325217 RepID=UPI00333871EC